ncbi:MAG: histidinol-phosphate transaminase [Treponema sp.]|nr:histidinol-phosphate transaminase [Treponema sp.]
MALKARKAVRNIPLYKPAKSIDSLRAEYGFDKVIKLAGNENTLGFSPKALAALQKSVSYYPDGQATLLRQKISGKFGVPFDNIICGNGSFELLFLVALAFLEEGDETVSAVPSFGWYKSATEIMGGKFIGIPVKTDFSVDLDGILAAISGRTKIIWLCNPNNPTGTVFSHSELESFLLKVPDDVVVVSDEAYIDFVSEENVVSFPDSISLVRKHKNLLVLRTFSKLEGLAFFRSGYGFADEELLSFLNRVRIPINITGPAQLASIAALSDDEFRDRTIRNVRSGRTRFYEAFDRLGLYYVPSNTNFVFFRTGKDSVTLVRELEKKGILVRAGEEYGFPDMLRISVGTEEENDIVIKELERLLK